MLLRFIKKTIILYMHFTKPSSNKEFDLITNQYWFIGLILWMFFYAPLNAQLSNKVQRLSNRIAKVDAVMIGVEATNLDERYQNNTQNPFNDLYGIRPNDAPYSANGRNRMDRRKYNLSYDRYLFLVKQRESQVQNFRDLTNAATLGEMLELTNHESPEVRCYAFWALLEQHYAESFEVLWSKLNDTEQVGLFTDDDLMEMKVGDFYILLMSQGEISSSLLKMTEAQEQKLETYLLKTNDNQLEERRKLILDLEPTEANYETIRNLALNTKDPKTIARLAKYKKEADIGMVNGLFFENDSYYAMEAIREWPNPAFLPKLKERYGLILAKKKGVRESELLIVYQALVQYPTAEINQLFTQIKDVKKKVIREKHLQYLWLALHKYPNPVFDKTFKSLKISSYQKREALERIKY